MGDDGDNSTLARFAAICVAGIALVADGSAGFYVGANVEKCDEMGAIRSFASC